MLKWRIANALFRTIDPRFWVQNAPTSYRYDKALRGAIENRGITSVGRYTAWIGGVEVWIENYPYAYGSAAGGKGFLPSPLTQRKLRKCVKEFSDKQVEIIWGEK